VFEWKNIAPIEAPDLWARIIYSALTYVSLGALLYYVKFYVLLSALFGRDRRGYREAKSRLWGMLMLVMFFFVVPFGVTIANSIVSFAYNMIVFSIYISPVVTLLFLAVIILVVLHRLRLSGSKSPLS
jgi:4-amino-4-deoxy-L-arabinose transferase-like glycosyltransferase